MEATHVLGTCAERRVGSSPTWGTILINKCMRRIIATLVFAFLLFATSAHSAVRWNPYIGLWEGNVCMNSGGWQIVPWQPVGSMCTMIWGGMPVRGVIVNL